MNTLYKNGLSRRELRNIHSVKKQYEAKNMGLFRKAIKIGVLGTLMLASYKCGQANAQELVQEHFSDLENVVARYESTNKVRDLYEEPIYRFRLPECETQCYLH